MRLYFSKRLLCKLMLITFLFHGYVRSFDYKNCFLPGTPTGSSLQSFGYDVDDYFSWHSNDFNDKHFQNVFKQIGQREAEYCNGQDKVHDNYVVLYHGQSHYVTFFQDLARVFFEKMHNCTFKNLVPLRLPSGTFKQCEDVDTLITYFDKKYRYWDDDGFPEVIDACMSTSPSLFSNINNWGESTYQCFTKPHPLGLSFSVTINKLVEKVFAYFNLKNFYSSYGSELTQAVCGMRENTKMQKILTPGEGWLLQIFLPKATAVQCSMPYEWKKYWFLSEPMTSSVYQNLASLARAIVGGSATPTHQKKNVVDSCVYLSKAFGFPIKGGKGAEDVLVDYKDDPSKAAKAIEDNCWEKGQHVLLYMQFRLYPHPDVFLNDNSGVKIFRYSRYEKNQKDLDAYWAELGRVANEIKEQAA
ncbi:MAG: hypothetical protein H6679_05310 [Epsilonproteobacteria bacterium]|nr:hypothetical protein [Campylobacterota bacterium]